MWVCKRCSYRREEEPKENWDTCPNCDSFSWMREGERNDMQWTTEPPAEPGWYWVIPSDDGGLGSDMTLVHFVCTDEVEVVGYDGSFENQSFTHWQGPQPQPEPPKE